MRTIQRTVAVAFLTLAAVAQHAHAQLPATRLSSIFPPGGNPGKTVEVTINGADLDDVNQLQFSRAGIVAKQKMAEPGPFDKGPQPVANQFVVTIAANVPLGVYEARAIGKYGASNPRAFTVGDIPETVEIEPNNDFEKATEVTAPALINGCSNQAADVDFFKFKAAAGQRIIVTSYARRIDSRIDSVVTVFDAAGRQVGGNRDDQSRDSLVDFTAAAAGEYTIKVNDAAYLGGPDFVYRISVGVLPHVDFVFPPAGLAGGNRAFTIYGRNLPGGQPAGLSINGRPLQKLSVSIPIPAAAAPLSTFQSFLEPASAGVDATEYRIKGPLGSSNPVLVGIAAAMPVVETEPNSAITQAQKLTVPCEVMGQFFPVRDRDWFQFEAKKGESFTVEVISRRLGVHSDPRLLVQRVDIVPPPAVVAAAPNTAAVAPAVAVGPTEKIQQLAYVYESGHLEGGAEFDLRSPDPEYRFTAASDGTYRLMVGDAYSDVDEDPRRVYRLVIRKQQPDFRLAAVPEGSHSAVLLRKGGQVGIRVVAFRHDGFDGEIRVTATQLPAGVTCTDAIIGPGSHSAMLTLSAAANAAPATALIQVTGRAKLGTADVTRVARFGAALTPTVNRATANQAKPSVASRVTRNLAVSVSASEPTLFTFQAGAGKVWETSRGGQIKIPYVRGGTFKGAISFIPRSLPPNSNSPLVNVGANATTGEFQLNLTATTPIGTHTFYLDGIAVQVNYARNPEAAVAAAARKKEVDQIKAVADAEAKAAAAVKTVADKLATDTTKAVTAATTAKAAADKALADAIVAARAATAKATQATAAAAAKPTDAGLKTAAANAQKAATDAAAKVKTATANVATATKTLADATVKAKAATDAKAASDKKAADTAERAKLAAALKVTTDKRAVDTTNAAKPKKRNVPIVSTPITIKVTPAPVTLTQPKAPSPLKQGEKLEVPIAIARLYKYPGQVNITTVLPPGVVGLSIPNAAVPANQTASKLIITAAANATEGNHDLMVRATMNLNGQNLTIEQTLRLVVLKVVVPTK